MTLPFAALDISLKDSVLMTLSIQTKCSGFITYQSHYVMNSFLNYETNEKIY